MNKNRNLMHIKKSHVGLMLVGALCFLVLVRASAKEAVHVTDVFPEEAARGQFVQETFNNVKAAHVFICAEELVEPVPEWLKPNVVAQDAIKKIPERFTIQYADGQQHQPDVLPCKYDPVLEEPGNLNFIIKMTIGKRSTGSTEPIHFVSIERFIYRPDHRTSIFAFMRGRPIVLDLGDDAKARQQFSYAQGDWMIGFSYDPKYNK